MNKKGLMLGLALFTLTMVMACGKSDVVSSLENPVSEKKENVDDGQNKQDVETDDGEAEVAIESITGEISADAILVKSPADSSIVDSVKSVLATIGVNSFEIYDITATDKNGNSIQPDGKVTITIETPEALMGYSAEEELAILYYNPEDNQFTECVTTVNDGTVSFETTHFSYYALILRVKKTRPENYNGEEISFLSGSATGAYDSHKYSIYVTKEGAFEGEKFVTRNAYVTWYIDGVELPVETNSGNFVYNGVSTPPFLAMYKLFGYKFYGSEAEAAAADKVRGGGQSWDGVVVTANDYEYVANMHNTLKDITYRLGYDLNWLKPVD